MTRDERQDLISDRWFALSRIVNNLLVRRGTLEAVTGFGKTRTAIKIVKRLRRDNTCKIIIVVPTENLKSQWLDVLNTFGESSNAEVYIINTIAKLQNLQCDLLILDEIHRYAADTFFRVFEVVSYKDLLGLTATIERLDKKHDILTRKAPIFDYVTMDEARRNRWISIYKEYNLGIKMSEQEEEWYKTKSEQFKGIFDKFSQDFGLMMKCTYSNKPRYNRFRNLWFDPESVEVARNLGWQGNTAYRASQIMKDNENQPRGRKANVWGNNTGHMYHPDRIVGYAVHGLRLNREMRDFILKNPKKIEVAKEILETFPDKQAITFAEVTETADELHRELGDSSVIYHSNMLPTTREVRKEKVYKTEKGADNWIEKHPEYQKSKRNGTFVVWTMVDKKVSAKILREEALERIQNDTDIRVILTAKALDLGFDYPRAELGIDISRTSNPTQHIQRTGRITRHFTFENGCEKEALMINIYIKDTKDYYWLKNSQKKSRTGVKWVNSLAEIVEDLERTSSLE